MNELSLRPQNVTEAMKLAEVLAKSKLVPKEYQDKPNDVLVALLHGNEIGLPPAQSLSSIAVINGRPTLWGDAGLALIEASGLLEAKDEHFDQQGKDEEGFTAVCIMKRKGRDQPCERRFSVKMAKQAGLWGKKSKDGYPTPWVTYPSRMLQMRARWLAMRDEFADVLRGMSGREEMEGVIEVHSEPAAPSLDDLDDQSDEKYSATPTGAIGFVGPDPLEKETEANG